jgi:hypothetical protein
VKWLAPTRIRLCHLVLQMIDLRFQYPLLEEWPVPPVPPVLPDLPELVRLGRLVADAGKTAGLPDFEIEAASALASLLGKNASLPLQALLTPWSSQDGDRGRELPVAELRLALLGAAMHTVWENTPESPADMSRLTVKTATALRDKLVKTLGKTMGQAVEHYAAGVKKRLDMSSKELTGIRSLLG